MITISPETLTNPYKKKLESLALPTPQMLTHKARTCVAALALAFNQGNDLVEYMIHNNLKVKQRSNL